MRFKLQFPPEQVPYWASKFPGIEKDEPIIDLGKRAYAQGRLTRADFLKLVKWKSRRTVPIARQNDGHFVEEISSVSFGDVSERLRIEVLTLLHGVSWPVASVLLHFCTPDRYPILDFRALRSLGVDSPPPYNFDLWWRYTLYCRRLSERVAESMRTVDRALWTYSKEN